jgi:hypothetical protein
MSVNTGDTIDFICGGGPFNNTSTPLQATITLTPISAIAVPIVVQVYINGSPLQMDVAPIIVNGRVLVPLRAIFEALGATVVWNANDQSIVATKGSITINLQIGSTTALNNGAQVTLDTAPQIVGGRTLVPARFVSEALGAQVTWDATNQKVNITTASP